MLKEGTIRKLTLNIKKFWITVGIAVLFVTIGVFGILRNYLEYINMETISQINQIHMQESSEKIQHHFNTIIQLRISQAQGLLAEAKEEYEYEELVRNLAISAEAFGFTFVGMYQMDGKLLTLYQDEGEDVQIINDIPFRESIKKGIEKVALGETQSGELLFLQGIPAKYSIGTTQGIALVTGRSMDFLNEELSLQENGDGRFSHIIRNDGTFVIKNDDNVPEDNYLKRVFNLAEASNMEGAQVLADVKEKMTKRESFSFYFSDGTLNHHCFFSPLTNSEWYLVSVMSEGVLDDVIQKTSDLRFRAVLIAGSIILLIILGSFMQYYVIEKSQRRAIEKAKSDAEAAKTEADQANRAKSEFLSNMSHDIRTPMNAIVGLATLAKSRTDNPDAIKIYLEKIIISGKHLLGLINDILDISKIESGKLILNMTPIFLLEAIDTMAEMIRPQIRAKKQKFDVVVHDMTADRVCCDSIRLNQVLLNLLSNAVKFTEEGGKIRFIVWQEPSSRGETYIRTHMVVQDSGIGMSEEFQRIIFESFSRENKEKVYHTEGTGLGMAITKCIIEAFDGTIAVESSPGQGSKFHVVLDLEKLVEDGASTVRNETVGENKKIDRDILQGKHVLLAEDNELNWEIANELLSGFGLVIHHAENGKRCLEMFKASDIGYYDIILMDIRMPVMNGYEAVKAIRSLPRQDASIPIIAMTADVFADDIKRCMDSGMNAHLAKPIDMQQAIAMLRDMLVL